MPASSWLIGTVPTGVEETIQVECPAGSNGGVDVAVPASALYLHDSSGARSWLSTFAAATLLANDDLTTFSFTLQRNRLIRIDADVAVGLNLGNLGVLLGFDTDPDGSSDTYTADRPSPLLWVPGLTEISEARLGRAGIPVYDAQQGGGGSFDLPVTTLHSYRVRNVLEWHNVINSRVWLNETGGEHFAFWREVLVPGRQFAHYRGLNNDEASTVSVGLSSPSRLGPYVWMPQSGRVEYEYDRSIKNVEARNNVRLPVTQVSEL